MANEQLTTIQIDVETRLKLKAIAEANERTSAGQLRWLVNLAYEDLPEELRVLPTKEDTKPKIKTTTKR